MQLQLETNADITAIHKLTQDAFRGRPYADGDEQEVIDRLRASNALTLSLLAFDNETLVGQITFSPASLEDGSAPWFALGPVSVTPARQGEGIGGLLIEQGLAEMQKLGALGCILTGNPDYYRRFGFQSAPANAPSNEPAEYFMLRLIAEAEPAGRFSFHPAFYG